MEKILAMHSFTATMISPGGRGLDAWGDDVTEVTAWFLTIEANTLLAQPQLLFCCQAKSPLYVQNDYRHIALHWLVEPEP